MKEQLKEINLKLQKNKEMNKSMIIKIFVIFIMKIIHVLKEIIQLKVI